MPPATTHPDILREIERLKRRIIWAERAGAERERQIAFVYRSADRFGRKVYPHTFCHDFTASGVGCDTGICCRCRPDVFAFEYEILSRLPQRRDHRDYCPFFNLTRKNCGIYAVRPLACRLYFNLAASAHACRNPNDTTLNLFAGLKPHLERILGPYQGGFDLAGK